MAFSGLSLLSVGRNLGVVTAPGIAAREQWAAIRSCLLTCPAGPEKRWVVTYLFSNSCPIPGSKTQLPSISYGNTSIGTVIKALRLHGMEVPASPRVGIAELIHKALTPALRAMLPR